MQRKKQLENFEDHCASTSSSDHRSSLFCFAQKKERKEKKEKKKSLKGKNLKPYLIKEPWNQ